MANSGEEIVVPIKERVKALLSAIEETAEHLRGLGFDGRHVENVMVFNAESSTCLTRLLVLKCKS